MLYEKSKEKILNKSLFENPTSEYRGAPFWAWNCELEEDELLRQIEIFKKMGLGGYHMHVRTGMATEYLSDEFLRLIKSCVKKGKKEGMLSYLYDEDRWPSGAAGGIVTKNKEYRQRFIIVTPTPYGKNAEKSKFLQASAKSGRSENGRLIACFDVELDTDGFLAGYRVIDENDTAQFDKWYVYLETSGESPWYNNQTYIDTLNKKAMDEFINITYNAYKRAVGDDFGKNIVSIFTDEPQISHKESLTYSTDKVDVFLPWTDDLPDTYKAQYSEDLIEHIPELIWDLKDKPSTVRYHYHDHVCERFVNAFSDNCSKWCDENGLALTGHMMMEDGLWGQSVALGEVMRCYRGFTIPGIDMLSGERHFVTAKQAQSAIHQYGREGMMSELYGVTGWDFDFRGHKLHGDWQAALGVTLRVQHLSWVSMKGEAKRDYPASINYQSSWHTEYKNVEDHFARVNTALTRGEPNVRVGVIHPIESYWLYCGPNDKTFQIREEMDSNFKNLNNWLVKNLIDFDFISESLLPELNKKGSIPFKVGKMEYDVILVPDCRTLRSTTLERLEDFKAAGGKLIFLGNAPKYENAVPSNRGQRLYNESETVQFTKQYVLDALKPYRTVNVLKSNGQNTERYCHQIRNDADSKWLFLAQAGDPYNKDLAGCEEIDIYINGEYSAELYDTVSGEIKPLKCSYENGQTKIRTKVYDCDSLLIKYSAKRESENLCHEKKAEFCEISLPSEVDYTLSEPNVLLLDMACVKLDNGEFSNIEELLRADNKLRKQLGYPLRMAAVAQPWAVEKEYIKHTVTLKFSVVSEITVDNVKLALEDADIAKITLNGVPITKAPDGYYVDKSIGTVELGRINAGKNIIEVTLPFGQTTNIECCYILGEFGVKVVGKSAVICAAPKKLYFGDLCNQGLAFYGGNVTYKIPVTTCGEDIKLHIPHYRGGLITVENEGVKTPIIYPPYDAYIKTAKGENLLKVTLYGNRHNCFGCIHNADSKQTWIGPNSWRTDGDSWCYEYVLKPMGILSTPKAEKQIL